MKNIKREDKPRIMAAADLVHLNHEQRLDLLGGEQTWLSRRDFLLNLLGTAALVMLPAALLSGCARSSPSPPVIPPTSVKHPDQEPEGTPETTTPLKTTEKHPDQEPKGTPETTTPLKTTDAPTATAPLKIDKVLYGCLWGEYEFWVTFDRDIDLEEFIDCFEIFPDVDEIDIKHRPIQTNYVLKNSFVITLPSLIVGQIYELRISGILKAVDGNQLDGNDDGIPGDDFYCSFLATGENTPGRYRIWPLPRQDTGTESPCSCDTHSSPSCGSDVQCAAWGGKHCFCEVECGCQLYRL